MSSTEKSKLHHIFTNKFRSDPSLQVRSPGRVNLLGEHVDYNDGPVLPMAIDLEVEFFANPSGNLTSTLFAVDIDEKIMFDMEDLDSKRDTSGNPLPSWALYPAGTAWALKRSGYSLVGINAVYSSNIPIGAGLSSSAAVEVGFVYIWSQFAGTLIEPLDIALISQRAENEYVGVSCGLMDQFSVACGISDHALYFDTRSLEWEPVPIPGDTRVLIVDSGIRRSLVNSEYNNRREACEKAVILLKQYIPELTSLRDIDPPEFMAYASYLPEIIRMRAEHVVKEIARVKSARRALEQGNINNFGALMNAGHNSLRDLYEVSTQELDTLVEISQNINGCYGSRLTGAGFGGCTVNLVSTREVTRFKDIIQEKYFLETGNRSTIYITHPCSGATAHTQS